MYLTLPFNYHINASEVSWKLLKDGAKMVPLIILLCKLELHALDWSQAVGVADIVRVLIKGINKLRVERGEVCFYQAMISFKKERGKYPTLTDIKTQLQKHGCTSRGCKFFQKRRNACTMKLRDIEAIASFLKDKKVIKNVSSDEWWACF